MISKKHCLFCNELVTVERKGVVDQFTACMCSPDGYYSLDEDTYSQINAFPYAKKRRLLPFVSAYIREQSTSQGSIHLTLEEVEAIETLPSIPATLEEKGKRLLIHLYHLTDVAYEATNLHPLSQHYNLTYSTNLQEFVYIIELLKESGMIEREGSVLKLTTLGWSEAMALAGGKKSKSCIVLLSSKVDISEEWTANVLPRIEQCGYRVELISLSTLRKMDETVLSRISESNLMIADLTESDPELYFAAGYAERATVPIIWTIRSNEAEQLRAQSEWIRPLIWEDAEQLMDRLQFKLE
ncbi:hypothetical protein I6N90_04370 [Paenibacillus sp. GSMTC-2017]|uniref:hypothetical protein n=1 Tax=Paenibacillus sp. GSMTC-2017 TaxID=2794350 RepID=UPI0018D8A820|nr:hypothetical protein [Paenibacillus sp. GSMTC-2017]MBH5317042.1 hypothetical protein [Paenibacillus sp. GSMTC-2017]